MKAQFITSCVACSNGDAINQMMDQARSITFQTFARHVDIKQVSQDFGYDRYLPLRHDWHVAFYKSQWNGSVCYIMKHSAIEYIYQYP